jgi:hypothetical protein
MAAGCEAGNEPETLQARPFKMVSELEDMMVAQASVLHGPWPAGMTLFVFDDAYGWTASISRPASEGDNFYRTCMLDLITRLRARYDLDTPRLPGPDNIFSPAFFQPCIRFAYHQTQGDRHGQRPAKRQSRDQKTQKREDQGNRRRAKPKGRGMAADLRFRQKEIEQKEQKEIEMAGGK